MTAALRAYREGARPRGFMEPVAANLDDDDIAQAAAYFSALGGKTEPPQTSVAAATLALGERIAKRPARSQSCISCHVDAATDNPFVPRLSGQPTWYLADQLSVFKSGVRRGTPNARLMAEFARNLSDEDINAVSAYFAQLQPPVPGRTARR